MKCKKLLRRDRASTRIQELFQGPRAQGEARPAGHAADIYACGVLLYRMTFQRYPYKGDNADVMVRNIMRGDIVWPAEAKDDELRLFIQSMLAPDWRRRPSIAQVKAHAVFRSNLPTELQVRSLSLRQARYKLCAQCSLGSWLVPWLRSNVAQCSVANIQKCAVEALVNHVLVQNWPAKSRCA